MRRATKLAPPDHAVPGMMMQVSPVLVGRQLELEQLRAALADPPALVLIEGEPGIGKSRLVSEAVQAGQRSLIGRCHSVAEPFPLGAVVEALNGARDMFGHLALPPITGALRPLIPELASQLPTAPADTGDRVLARRRLHRAVGELLRAAGPITLVLEDLHWADEQTLDLLAKLLEDGSRGQLSLILTTRDEGPVKRVRALLECSSVPATHVSLAGLSAAEVGNMVGSILDAGTVSAEFADYLHERTGGLPFAIEEVLALLQSRRTLVRDDDGWTRRDLSELGVPGPVRDSVLERISRMGSAASAATDAAAVLREPVPAATVITVAELEPSAGEEALAEAASAGILVERDGSWGVRHMLAAEAVTDEMSTLRRRHLHGRAADALARAHAPPMGRIADHLAHAGRHADWVITAEQAADHATEVGHVGEATRHLLALAQDRAVPLDTRVRVAHKLGGAALQAMAHEQAVGVLHNVLSEADLPQSERGQLRMLLAGLWYQVGDYGECYDQVERAVTELAADRAAQAHAMARLANVYVPGRSVSENEQWADRAITTATACDDPSIHAHARARAFAVWVTSGNPRWRSTLELLSDMELATDPVDRAAYAHNRAVTATFAGLYDTARTAASEGLQIVLQIGNERLIGGLHVVQAVLQYHTGQWPGLPELEELLDQNADLPGHAVELHWLIGSLALATGDLSTATTKLETAFELVAQPSWFQIWLSSVAGSLTRLRLTNDDAEGAVQCSQAALDVLRGMDLWAAAGPLMPWAVRALVADDLTAARGLVTEFSDGLHNRDAPLAEIALLVAQATVLEAEGAKPGAAEQFQTAATAYTALGNPYEAAFATEHSALVLGDGARARKAMQQFELLGATWDAARCARAARQMGVRVPTPYRGGRRGYGDELSPREQQVAELAATGLTNRAIAEELQLSPTTVGKHLGRAMRKLDVRSRTAIDAKLR